MRLVSSNIADHIEQEEYNETLQSTHLTLKNIKRKLKRLNVKSNNECSEEF